MEIYQLRTFLAVAKTGNLTRAAEQLHMTQPAVSAQIRGIEEELSIALFQRTHNGVTLTAAGQLLLPHAEHVLAAFGDLVSQTKKLKGEIACKIRIGTIIDPSFLKLGDILHAMLERYPLIEIETIHGISGGIMQSLKDGELDAGFFLANTVDASLHAIPLRDVVYRVVAAPKFAAQLANAAWEDLAQMPWIWTPEHSSHNRIISEMLQQRGLAPVKKVIKVDLEPSITDLVIAGVGLGLMREDLAETAFEAGEVILWEHGRGETVLSLGYLRSREHDPEIIALASLTCEKWSVAFLKDVSASTSSSAVG